MSLEKSLIFLITYSTQHILKNREQKHVFVTDKQNLALKALNSRIG